MKERIEEYKGYVIRTVGKDYLIAIPEDVTGFAHNLNSTLGKHKRAEKVELGFDQMKIVIDEYLENEKTTSGQLDNIFGDHQHNGDDGSECYQVPEKSDK